MRSIKMLGLLVSAIAALMALAGSASATYLTSPAGTTYTSTIKAESEGTVTLVGSFVTIHCYSEFAGKIESHGLSTTAGGKLASLTFYGCDYPTTVNKAGSLEIHTESSSGSNGNGTVTSTGIEFTATTSVGQCIFTTNGTDIGVLTGSKNTKATATLHMRSQAIPRTGGSAGFLCGSSGLLSGSFTFTTPDYLDVH